MDTGGQEGWEIIRKKKIYYARFVCLLVSVGAAHLEHDLVMD